MTFNTQAIVLATKSWPRQARLYTLYTKRFGKIKAVVRGAEKVTSKISGHLSPYAISEIMCAKGKNIDTLAQARVEYVFSSLQKDWDVFMPGLYILELVNRFTEEGVSDQYLWDLIVGTLTEIDTSASWHSGSGFDHSVLNLHARKFALKYLSHMGYTPELYHCLQCRQSLQPQKLMYSLLQGGCICGGCSHHYPESIEVNPNLIKLLRVLISDEEGDKIHIESGMASEVILMIDKIVSVYMHKPLRSATLFL